MTSDRALPELTQLVMEVKTSDSGARSLHVTFLVNVQQTLHPEFDAIINDAVLAHAHHRGHIPVGPLLWVADTWQPPEQSPLSEGHGLLSSLGNMTLWAAGKRGDIVQITADVELGLSL